MKKYKLKNDIKVFGVRVENFPSGIGEAFDELVKVIPDGFKRPYYGISYLTDEGISYHATVLEKVAGEAERYNCPRHTIAKGNYATVTVKDWRKKTHLIKDVFKKMSGTICPDEQNPCVEWYKNDDEMVCMSRERSSNT